jgi:hypothetical protein
MYILQGRARLTRHTLFTLDLHMVQDHTSPVVRVGNVSLVPTIMKQTPTPERSLSDQRQTGPTIALGHLILPPLWQPWSRRERFCLSGYTATPAYWAHNTIMRSVRSIHARGSQSTGPSPTQAGATILKVPAFHNPLPMVSTFHPRAPPGL